MGIPGSPAFLRRPQDRRQIRVHRILDHTSSNGPGTRCGIWVQGCTLGCPGCFNPETHPPEGGTLVPLETIFRRIRGLGDGIEGITLTGGEPLQQMGPVTDLLRLVRKETRLSIVLFTGYTRAEIREMEGGIRLSETADILIAGRYDRTRPAADGLRSSSNQTVHFPTGRYTGRDIADVPDTEMIIELDGKITVTGVRPPTADAPW